MNKLISEMEFPVYRKYSNEKHFFKIISENEFEEIQIIGSKYAFHRTKAEKLPEMNQIKDMIDLKEGDWVKSSKKEYQEVFDKCKKERKKI